MTTKTQALVTLDTLPVTKTFNEDFKKYLWRMLNFLLVWWFHVKSPMKTQFFKENYNFRSVYKWDFPYTVLHFFLFKSVIISYPYRINPNLIFLWFVRGTTFFCFSLLWLPWPLRTFFGYLSPLISISRPSKEVCILRAINGHCKALFCIKEWQIPWFQKVFLPMFDELQI